jgi:hypothetical protein
MAITAPRSYDPKMSFANAPGRAFVLALVGVVCWAAPAIARACSCIPPGSPASAAADAQAVFEGRTFAVEHRGGKAIYRFEVSRVWKGDVGSDVDLQTAISSSLCGRAFETGTSYVVYAHASEGGGLADNICSRTRASSSATEDLVALGPGSPPRGPQATVAASNDVEPPRIEPAPPLLSRKGRGCAIDRDPDLLALPMLAMLVVASRRRRPAKDPA